MVAIPEGSPVGQVSGTAGHSLTSVHAFITPDPLSLPSEDEQQEDQGPFIVWRAPSGPGRPLHRWSMLALLLVDLLVVGFLLMRIGAASVGLYTVDFRY